MAVNNEFFKNFDSKTMKDQELMLEKADRIKNTVLKLVRENEVNEDEIEKSIAERTLLAEKRRLDIIKENILGLERKFS